MPRDAEATRARILDAAIHEFSASGLAGGRIDRIAEAAEANKRSIYVYFTDKETLFGAALAHVIDALTAEVPVTEDDLPGYAARVFDYNVAHPEAWRMMMWRKLERPGVGPDYDELVARKLTAIRGRGRDNAGAAKRSGLSPVDLFYLVMGLAYSWQLVADLEEPYDTPAARRRITAHRKAVVEGVSRLLTPR